MQNIPNISIIVPIYNAETTLPKCLDSIACQTYKDFEVLLIDDGSTDASGSICEHYAEVDSRFRVHHQANGGVSSARNKGLDLVLGVWVTFVDADDWVYSCWLENFINAMTSHADLIVQGFRMKSFCSKLNKHKESIHGFEFEGDIEQGINMLYKDASLGFLWVKMFKKEVIVRNKIRFYEEMTFTEDCYFVMEYLSYIHEIVCTNEIGYCYNEPDWEAKYSHAVFVDMSLLHSLCLKALRDKNAFLFSFYVGNLIHGLFDSYIKRLSEAKSNLFILADVVKAYKKQNEVVCKYNFFIYLKVLLSADFKNLILTHCFLVLCFVVRKVIKK